MTNYLSKHLSAKVTPQSEPIPGSKQVQNNAGGYVYQMDLFDAVDRFLILGSEGNTYYCTERKMTKDNAQRVLQAIQADGVRVVNRIVEISDAGRAPKNDPALFALAMAMKLGDEATRKTAREALPKVARIGTHLFHFAQFVETFGGWGRGTKKAISSWYLNRSVDSLAKQITKYQSRDGWSHSDLIRLAHVKTDNDLKNRVLQYAGAKYTPGMVEMTGLEYLQAVEEIKNEKDVKKVIKLITDFDLPREVVPTQMLNHPEVWEAMLPHMGITAMVRNLAKMTSIGLIAPLSNATRFVIDKMTDANELKKARVHPIQMLVALKTYEAGRGNKGSLSWTPVQNVVNALDSGFYQAFGAVETTNKNLMLALDVSASMTWGNIAGIQGFTPAVASAAMALVTAAREPNTFIVGFGTELKPIAISPKMRLDDVVRKIQDITMGGTDCSLPMTYATKKKMRVDGFVVYTDSETWYGGIHPSQALKQYRSAMNVDAKSVVVGMLATDFTIADPKDKGMLDVVGFDTAAPNLIADFIAK